MSSRQCRFLSFIHNKQLTTRNKIDWTCFLFVQKSERLHIL